MVEFWIYDVAFLVLFVVGILYFLRKHNKTLDKEGWMYMYRTQWAVKFINHVGKKYKVSLSRLRYVVVAVGYLLMAGILYLFGKTVWIYISNPLISEVIKAPPVAPLIPYFPQLFGMESFFPSFYFTYFLIAIAIVAFVHEFSHGIFMKFSKIKIKSTGIVFLGPILGAFVEEDKKSFDGKGKFNRLSVLGAGVFANLMTGIIFFFLMWGLFHAGYESNGYVVGDYAALLVPVETIVGVNNLSNNLISVETESGDYLWFEDQEFVSDGEYVKLYYDSPAIREGVQGSITMFNGETVESRNDFYEMFNGLRPGDRLILASDVNGETEYYGVELTSHPGNEDIGFLGVAGGGIDPKESLGEFTIYSLLLYLKGSAIDYQPYFSFIGFMFNLMWWIVLINFLVALFNMLPVGILDGGQFFYISILGITKNEKFAKRAYKFITKLILFAFLAIMAVWLYRLVF